MMNFYLDDDEAQLEPHDIHGIRFDPFKRMDILVNTLQEIKARKVESVYETLSRNLKDDLIKSYEIEIKRNDVNYSFVPLHHKLINIPEN